MSSYLPKEWHIFFLIALVVSLLPFKSFSLFCGVSVVYLGLLLLFQRKILGLKNSRVCESEDFCKLFSPVCGLVKSIKDNEVVFYVPVDQTKGIYPVQKSIVVNVEKNFDSIKIEFVLQKNNYSYKLFLSPTLNKVDLWVYKKDIIELWSDFGVMFFGGQLGLTVPSGYCLKIREGQKVDLNTVIAICEE